MNISKVFKETFFKKPDFKRYQPSKLVKPEKTLDVVSAWKGLELIIEDILDEFKIGRERCIEFGVEFGYSTVVFSNFFEKVTGVDTFEGDIHTDNKENHYEQTKEALSVYQNIELFKSDYQTWIQKDNSRYDFAHVDIVHTYQETFECGLWTAKHSDCTIFHDTESFPDVKQAVLDIARQTGQSVYNFPDHFGLGILVDRKRLKNRKISH
ncbi:Methyltransferase domain-containing protein [Dyadobacter koreensis]|uniref:Methyltransferase domain-containing protein n=1 Tax=Dyadobacter koreensis TaxID=408657 RepID=A0A1H6T7C9_9BACT|nr:class I SAM-dependent methyltransferase [Dyadobacter koreensis]SEI71712.1 Methyltransferase domain-containing protein [Dyadobacter koreensis]